MRSAYTEVCFHDLDVDASFGGKRRVEFMTLPSNLSRNASLLFARSSCEGRALRRHHVGRWHRRPNDERADSTNCAAIARSPLPPKLCGGRRLEFMSLTSREALYTIIMNCDVVFARTFMRGSCSPEAPHGRWPRRTNGERADRPGTFNKGILSTTTAREIARDVKGNFSTSRWTSTLW